MEQRALEQWFLKITDYATNCCDDIAKLEGGWPERVLDHAAQLDRPQSRAPRSISADRTGEPIRVFTTRVDTIYGATCVILAPEHPLVDRSTRGRTTCGRAQAKVMIDARGAGQDAAGDAGEGGFFTGRYATILHGEKVPIWVGNFVLMGYGTGAIMAVPAHDERDFEFCHAVRASDRAAVIRPVDGELPDGATMRRVRRLRRRARTRASSRA